MVALNHMNDTDPKTLITAKVNPDLDGVACTYAYSYLLNKQGLNVVGGVFGQPHPEAQYLINRFQIDDINNNPQDSFDKFILVDASDIKGMPSVVRAEDVIEAIDHRKADDISRILPNAKIQNELIGAAATLITEKFYDCQITISQNAAILLYGAIYSNTLNFKVEMTNKRDYQAVEWLRTQTEIPDGLIHQMFLEKTKSISNNLQEVLSNDFKSWIINNQTFGVAQLEVVQLSEIIQVYYEQIIEVLNKLKETHQLQMVFLTAVDLEEEYNLFVTPDHKMQSILSKVFNIEFTNNLAKRNGLLLRKQIVPLVKEAIERETT